MSLSHIAMYHRHMDETDVRMLQARLKALQRRLRAERIPVAGLSGSAVRVLGTVARTGELQPGQIVDELQMTTSNVAAALRELDAVGVIQRRKDEVDARRVNITLTDAGERLLAENRAARDGWLADAIDALLDDDEQATLRAAGVLLERLARFDAVSIEKSGR